MTTLIIQQSQDYWLHVSIEPTHSPPNSVAITVQSQWLRAKDPHGLQTRYRQIFAAGDAIRIGEELQKQAELSLTQDQQIGL
jgi:hypothetical protein